MTNKCVCCGSVIPEGRQVCFACEKRGTKALYKLNVEIIVECKDIIGAKEELAMQMYFNDYVQGLRYVGCEEIK